MPGSRGKLYTGLLYTGTTIRLFGSILDMQHACDDCISMHRLTLNHYRGTIDGVSFSDWSLLMAQMQPSRRMGSGDYLSFLHEDANHYCTPSLASQSHRTTP
jgi:hypothetical protein